MSFVSAAWFSCLDKVLTPLSVKQSFLIDTLDTVKMQWFNDLILYSSVLLVGYMLDYKERLARQQTEAMRLSEQLSKAQLSALRQQIEPHFLFNTLNAIVGLVREGRNDAAVSMIVVLSELMLRVLKDSDRQEVSLGEELEFLQKYLHIQKVRFAERLQLQIIVPEELFMASVPTFVLQPIVENAIKAWHREAGPRWLDSGQRGAVEWVADFECIQRWSPATSGQRPESIRNRHRQYADAPANALWKYFRYQYAESGALRRGGIRINSFQQRIVSGMDRDPTVRVLLVDDEPLARANLRVLLRRDPTIEIVGECTSGMEALAEIRDKRPALVFLDVQMPECDGFDVLESTGQRPARGPGVCDGLRSICAARFRGRSD